MTTFENTALIDKPSNEVYSFLADLNNHEQLMPENVYNWSSTKDEARFSIQNMGSLALKVSDRVENQSITITPSEKAPFPVKLTWILNDAGENRTQAVLTISADLNMMTKMLASGPLQKLTDYQANKLKTVIGGQ
jgi:hypothetical protein